VLKQSYSASPARSRVSFADDADAISNKNILLESSATTPNYQRNNFVNSESPLASGRKVTQSPLRALPQVYEPNVLLSSEGTSFEVRGMTQLHT